MPTPARDDTIRARLVATGRSLRHRNYRLFFGGQSISLIGTWLTRAATAWLVYRLTGSGRMLGLVGFAGQLPTFFLAPIAGVLVDRWNRHRVLVVTQVLSLVQSALLAWFTFAGFMTVPHLLWLSVFQGLVNAFDMPARQSLVVQMVDAREDLPNAIALNSSMVNLARLVGPSVAGLLIAAVGEGWCFAIDAASYGAVIASLALMRITPRTRTAPAKRLGHELAEGFRYVARSAPIRSVLLLLALVSLMGMPYTVLMPVVAGSVLHGGPGTYGTLMSAVGAGALSGAIYLASRRSVLGLGRVIAVTALSFGLALAAFSFAPTLWAALPVLVVAGASMMLQMAASNTIIQTIVEEDKRGRVMSLYAMAFFGTVPFGSLFAGLLADHIGASRTILIGGVACVLGGLAFLRALPALRRVVAPIYRRLGILPEIAEGLRTASERPEE